MFRSFKYVKIYRLIFYSVRFGIIPFNSTLCIEYIDRIIEYAPVNACVAQKPSNGPANGRLKYDPE